MKTIAGIIVALVILSIAGSIVKIYGALAYGSRSLFVDALTCFANIAALIFTIYFYKLSITPPDTDHPFGHYRLGIGGTLASMITYSFVAGISSMELLRSTDYVVEMQAVYYAIIGCIIYSVVIFLALRIDRIFKTYGAFTVSELIEGIVVIMASLGGALYSYLIDYAGAIILTLYIFYELIVSSREVLAIVSDKAPSHDILMSIRELIERNNFFVKEMRIRCVYPGKYHGDIKVYPTVKSDYEHIWDEIEELKKILLKRYSIDSVIEVIPATNQNTHNNN